MLKNILNLEGAQELSNNEQKTIKGGYSKQCVDAVSANGCYIVSSCTDNQYDATYEYIGLCGANVRVCC